MEQIALSSYRDQQVEAFQELIKGEIDALRGKLRQGLEAFFNQRVIEFEATVQENIKRAIEAYDRNSIELEKYKHLPSYGRAAISLKRDLEAAIVSNQKALEAFKQTVLAL